MSEPNLGASSGPLKVPFWERQLDYMQGKENGIRNIFLAIAGLFGLTWLWSNSASVVDFLTDVQRIIALLTENVILVAVGLVVTYVVYQIIASPRTWRLLAMIVDGVIRSAEMRYRSGGNAIKAAYFDLELLKRKIKRFLSAETVIRGVYNSSKDAAERTKQELDRLLAAVRALTDDIERRKGSMKPSELTTQQAQLSGKEREAVSKANLLKTLIARMANQGRRLAQLEVYRELMTTNIQAGEAELKNLEAELESARQDALAMEAADAVIGHFSESQFGPQLDIIRGKIAYYRAVSDQFEIALQPDAARYISDKRLEVLTTDETFGAMLTGLGASQREMQKALNPADESLVAYEQLVAEVLPGNTGAERQTVKVQRDISGLLR